MQAGSLLTSLAGGNLGRRKWRDQLSCPGPHTWDDTLWHGEEVRLLQGGPQAFLSPDRRPLIVFPCPPTLASSCWAYMKRASHPIKSVRGCIHHIYAAWQQTEYLSKAVSRSLSCCWSPFPPFQVFIFFFFLALKYWTKAQTNCQWVSSEAEYECKSCALEKKPKHCNLYAWVIFLQSYCLLALP